MDDSRQSTPVDVVVFGFCELCGLIFGLPPGEDLYHGAPMTLRMGIFLFIGVCFAVAGPAWPWFKNRIPRQLFASVVNAACDFRWWLALLLFLFAYSSFSYVGLFELHQQLSSIQKDLKRFVLPRQLTEQQSKQISQSLLASPYPHQSVTIYFLMHNSESAGYASSLYKAIKAGGWKPQMVPKTDLEMLKENPNVGEGICINATGEQQTDNGTPSQFLNETLENAKVSVPCGGGGSGPTKLEILVGHRPRTYNPEMKEVPIEDND